jgi:hypothetical protein
MPEFSFCHITHQTQKREESRFMRLFSLGLGLMISIGFGMSCGSDTKRPAKCKVNCDPAPTPEAGPRQSAPLDTQFNFWESKLRPELGAGKSDQEREQILVALLNSNPISILGSEWDVLKELHRRVQNPDPKPSNEKFNTCLSQALRAPAREPEGDRFSAFADYGKCIPLAELSGLDSNSGYQVDALEYERVADISWSCAQENGICGDSEYKFENLLQFMESSALGKNLLDSPSPRLYSLRFVTGLSHVQQFRKANQVPFKLKKQSFLSVGDGSGAGFEILRAGEDIFKVNGGLRFLTTTQAEKQNNTENLKGIKLVYEFKDFVVLGSKSFPANPSAATVFLGEVNLSINEYRFSFRAQGTEYCNLEVYNANKGPPSDANPSLGKASWCQSNR